MSEPGWYNDVDDPALARWHDGTSFTRHTIRKQDWVGRGMPPAPAEGTTSSAALDKPAPTGPPLWAKEATPPAVKGPAAKPATSRAARLLELVRERRRLVLAVGAVVVLVLVALVLTRDDGEGGRGSAATSAGGQTYGGDWSGPDGAWYRLTVTPHSVPSDHASEDGCIAVPERGSINLTFTARVENIGDDEAPVPEVRFGTNLTDDGEIAPAVVSLETSSRHLEVQPHPKGADCGEVAAIAGDGTLEPGEAKTYTATLGHVVASSTQQPFVIAQWDEAAGDATSPTEILIPFAVRVDGGSTSTSAG